MDNKTDNKQQSSLPACGNCAFFMAEDSGAKCTEFGTLAMIYSCCSRWTPCGGKAVEDERNI